MVGRRRRDDKTKTSKQKRLFIILEYLIDEWLNVDKIPFEWLVEIYKNEFGYYGDKDDTVEITVKRDCSLLLKQGFISQESNTKSTLSKAPICPTERLKTVWGFSAQKNRKLKKFLEDKYAHLTDSDEREDKIYEEYAEESISAFDVSVQIIQVIMLREMDIEKETINRSNRHFFPFDIVVARDKQDLI